MDVALPLGLPYDADPAAVRAALQFLTTGRAGAFVPRGRVDGLRLEAPGAQFTYGTGPDITGHGIELLAAVCGRTAVLERLDGPGVAVLAERIGGTATR